jgi:hypothetical protein
MATTRKRGHRAVPRRAYGLVRATLLDPDTMIRVEPFDQLAVAVPLLWINMARGG